MIVISQRVLLEVGWIKAKRKDGSYDWVYPGCADVFTYQEAAAITVRSYPRKYVLVKL